MKRNINLYLQDMWESIAAIEEYTKVLTEEEFSKNCQVQDAVVRRLEVIGEAAKNVSEETRKKYSDIPWRKITGMRDILTHEYFGVNLKRVWEVVKRDLPRVKQNLSTIMRKK